MVSKSHHWLHQFQLVTEHLLKDATNYGNRATGVGTKHAVLRPRPRPGSSGLETKTENLAIRSRDRDRYRDKMNSSALESRDHGLEITTLMIHQSAAQGSGVLHQEASTSNSTDPPPPPVRVKLFAQYSLLRSTRVTGSPSTQ